MTVDEAIVSSTYTGNKMILPPGLDRKLYQAVNKVIECRGGTWSRKDKAHVFPKDARAAMITTEALPTHPEDARREAQQFFTPPWLAEQVVKWSMLSRETASVLEPSAGSGNLVKEAAKIVPASRITCFEDDQKLIPGLKALGASVNYCDFLEFQGSALFDVCIMNPPFKNQQGLKHVLHAFKFLHPRGVLVALLPSGATSRGRTKLSQSFNDLLDLCGEILEPRIDGAFKEEGTDVSVCAVRMVKA